MIGNPLLLGGEGYQISRSVRLRSSASAYFNRTPASAGNRSTWTWSGWVKRGVLGSSQNTLFAVNVGATDTTYFQIAFGTVNPDCLLINSYNITSLGMQTAAVFRDPSAWYHVVFALDTTQANASNRMKLYVNGVQQTSFLTYINYPALNSTFAINTAAAHNIGASNAASNFDGYLTEVNFIDGQALTPSSFGETDAVTGVWKPKKYAGTYGTNGFYLNFSDPSAATAAAIGKDSSGNGNNWTPNNISVTAGVTYDSMLDVPTMWADGGNGRGNYATLNPLGKSSTAVLADGNLALSNSTLNTYPAASTGIYPASGSWYFEATFTGSGTQECSVGMSNLTTFASLTHQTAAGNVYWNSNNGIYKDGAVFSGGAGKTFTFGDVIGVAYDIAAGTITFYKNGVAQTPVVTGVGASYSPTLGFNYYTAGVLHLNCGQRPFAYTPPTGFKALNTQNLPDATIKKGSTYFDAKTHIGYATGAWFTLGTEFDIDLIWTKNRSGAYNHVLVDSVRGDNNSLASNTTAAENTSAGVLLGRGANSKQVYFNGSVNEISNTGQTYVDWCWKESVSAGFDIVTWTGNGTARTIAHNLGVTPSMFLVKRRDAAGSWRVFHNKASATPQNGCLFLEGTQAFTTTTIFNNTAPTSTTFAVGTDPDVNANGGTYVAYLFSEVAGYSKFGSYTGNGSADGPFVYLGFRPKFVLIKNASGAYTWITFDSARGTYNVNGQQLYPNTSDAEATDNVNNCMDFLSNGFKFRGASAVGNGSGNTIIYAAFAENPFKNSLAR